MRLYIYVVCTLLFNRFLNAQTSMGKQVLFKRANFGYNLTSIQGFIEDIHRNILTTRCVATCMGIQYCGSLVYVKSSQSCMLLKTNHSTSIPVSGITAKNDDAQVWVSGKKNIFIQLYNNIII